MFEVYNTATREVVAQVASWFDADAMAWAETNRKSELHTVREVRR